MRLVRYSILTLIAISSFSLVKVPPVKADIFDMLRGLSACEDECLRKYDEAKLILISEPYKSAQDIDNRFKMVDSCGSSRTVASMRCLQNLVIKAKQRELDIQTKAGLMAAQGKIYGLVDTDDDNQLDLLKNQISAEIERLVEKARADALKLNPHPNKDAARIYSPASNNALAVDKYLDLQKRPANYRRAYCTRTTPFSEQAVCNILKSALADELED